MAALLEEVILGLWCQMLKEKRGTFSVKVVFVLEVSFWLRQALHTLQGEANMQGWNPGLHTQQTVDSFSFFPSWSPGLCLSDTRFRFNLGAEAPDLSLWHSAMSESEQEAGMVNPTKRPQEHWGRLEDQ